LLFGDFNNNDNNNNDNNNNNNNNNNNLELIQCIFCVIIIKCTLKAGGIEIWKCCFLWREENWRTWRKTLEQGGEPTTNSAHMTPGLGIIPVPHWWKASILATALWTIYVVTSCCQQSTLGNI